MEPALHHNNHFSPTLQPWFNMEAESLCHNHPSMLQPSSYAVSDCSAQESLIEWQVLKLLRPLLRDGVDLNFKDPSYSLTLLMWSCALGRMKLVRFLVESAQVSIEDTDNFGYTAFLWAVHRGQYHVVQYLISIAKVKADVMGTMLDQSAIMLACSIGHINLVRLLCGILPVDWRNGKGETALAYAAFRGHVGVLMLLLGEGYVTFTPSCRGVDVLLLLCKEGHWDAFVYLSTKVDFSLLSRVDLVALLRTACRYGHGTIVENLLERAEVDLGVITDPRLRDCSMIGEDMKVLLQEHETKKRNALKTSTEAKSCETKQTAVKSSSRERHCCIC